VRLLTPARSRDAISYHEETVQPSTCKEITVFEQKVYMKILRDRIPKIKMCCESLTANAHEEALPSNGLGS
jgi:hypothetical protein